MREEFRLPDLGEGLAEAEILQWHVAEGDEVSLNQTLAEVETAKAVVELPSPYAGRVAALHASAGDTVLVGAPLIDFSVDDEGVDDQGTGSASADHGEGVGEEEQILPTLVGYGSALVSGRPARRPRRPMSPTASDPQADAAVLEAAPHDAHVTETPPHSLPERPRSTPPVRAYAKSRGADLALVAAELGDRVIAREDVDAYLGRLADRSTQTDHRMPVSTPARGAEERTTRVPIRGVRRHTADAMVRSAFTAPHVTTFHTVDVTATMELIEALRADPALHDGPRIGPLAVIAKTVCLALPHHPGLNAFWDEGAQEIVHNHFVDLGIAVATDRGLIVPIVRDADRLSLAGMAGALAALTETARSGRSAPADLTGGTFSITNVGVYGIDAGTPILPPGQSGILAVGAVRARPWEHRGEIALRQVMTLSLSFDHRLVDGAEGAQFLKAVADVLEEPARSMLF